MIEVRRLTPDEWTVWREVRLAALADAPYAYGSTLARERAFDEATWRSRLSPANGMAAVAAVAGQVVGAVAAHVAPDAEAPQLVAMWAHPRHRGIGLGDALVGEVLAWARESGWPRVELRVVADNTAARALFARNGFVPAGAGEALESDPAVDTVVMVHPVTQESSTTTE